MTADLAVLALDDAFVELEFHVQTFLLWLVQQGLRAPRMGVGWATRDALWNRSSREMLDDLASKLTRPGREHAVHPAKMPRAEPASAGSLSA